MQLDLSSEGTEPASHVVQFAEPYGATWFAAHATQPPSTIAQPGSHLMQLDLSSEGTEPASHVVQFAEPYGATWFAAHSTQRSPIIAQPGSHLRQRERSADGMLPLPHASHAAEEAERAGLAPSAPQLMHAPDVLAGAHVPGVHPSHSE